jgi:hypothetical protein
MKACLSIITCLVFIFIHPAFAQQTKVKQVKGKDTLEEYEVLVSDKNIKHGYYMNMAWSIKGKAYLISLGSYNNNLKNGKWEYYFENHLNEIKEEGFYKNGLRDSLWTYYFPEKTNGNLRIDENTGSISIDKINTSVMARGHFLAHNKTGVWDYYSSGQQLLQQYDHDRKKLLYHHDLKDSSSWKRHDAVFIGGEYHLYQTLHESFNFNDLMDKVNILHVDSGRLTLQFTIGVDGAITGITQPSNTINNKKVVARAYEAIRTLEHQWIPAVKDGITVTSTKAVRFSLENSSHAKNGYVYRNQFASSAYLSTRTSIRVKYGIEVLD